jgi:hypothetical protein
MVMRLYTGSILVTRQCGMMPAWLGHCRALAETVRNQWGEESALHERLNECLEAPRPSVGLETSTAEVQLQLHRVCCNIHGN